MVKISNSEYAALVAERDALRVALEPFARAAEKFDERDGGHTHTDRVGLDAGLTVGNLFDARRALAD